MPRLARSSARCGPTPLIIWTLVFRPSGIKGVIAEKWREVQNGQNARGFDWHSANDGGASTRSCYLRRTCREHVCAAAVKKTSAWPPLQRIKKSRLSTEKNRPQQVRPCEVSFAGLLFVVNRGAGYFFPTSVGCRSQRRAGLAVGRNSDLSGDNRLCHPFCWSVPWCERQSSCRSGCQPTDRRLGGSLAVELPVHSLCEGLPSVPTPSTVTFTLSPAAS